MTESHITSHQINTFINHLVALLVIKHISKLLSKRISNGSKLIWEIGYIKSIHLYSIFTFEACDSSTPNRKGLRVLVECWKVHEKPLNQEHMLSNPLLLASFLLSPTELLDSSVFLSATLWCLSRFCRFCESYTAILDAWCARYKIKLHVRNSSANSCFHFVNIFENGLWCVQVFVFCKWLNEWTIYICSSVAVQSWMYESKTECDGSF